MAYLLAISLYRFQAFKVSPSNLIWTFACISHLALYDTFFIELVPDVLTEFDTLAFVQSLAHRLY
jgi:hypothetical protein